MGGFARTVILLIPGKKCDCYCLKNVPESTLLFLINKKVILAAVFSTSKEYVESVDVTTF